MAIASQMMLMPPGTFPDQAGFIPPNGMVGSAGLATGFTLQSDGRMLRHAGSSLLCAPYWFFPGQAGIGAGFWGRIDRVSGTGGNDGVNNATAVQLNVDRVWQQNVGGDGIFNFRIARDAAMTQVVVLCNNFRMKAS